MAKFYTPTKLSENIRETPEGFLLCLNVPIARTGWMEYGPDETPIETGEDGLVHIYRSEDEVFRPQTIASFEGKDVTVKHPKDFVNPDNWNYLSKGIAQNVRRADAKDADGEYSLLADLLIKDSFTIKLVKAGLREVSCGYEAEYEQTSDGKGIQTNIVGNHIALVEQGRAGSNYAINDHKWKVPMFKELKEKLKVLSRTVDEAAAKEDKEEKAKDEDMEEKEKSKDAAAYDELVKMVKDLGEKLEGMSKPKDEASEKDKEEKSKDADKEEKESESKDDDGMSELMERVKALEAAMAKMLESKDEDMEESEDDDMDMSGGESMDEDMEKADKKKVGDSKKKTGLEKTKQGKTFDQFESKVEIMTAERLNEINAAHWARK